ncbi:MAG: protein kinase, partial [Chloroflexota bacterium]
YRALDIKLNRYAALKIMSQPTSTKKATYHKRFDREAQAIAKLKHPNIVTIYRFNEVGQIYYMAMEYVDGADLRWVLREYIHDDELMDYDTMFKIMSQVSSALDYAHQNGVIHRDIKPSNIMISRDDTAILTDFGLALDVQEGTGGEIFGSPHYIAPEQAISSAQSEPRTDFYSLGVILFEILTGSIPFQAQSALQVAMAHISDPLPDPLTINPNLHPAFLPVLNKMLEKNPADRYENGASFIKALQSAVRQAKRSNKAPSRSTMGSPADRIESLLPPLPQPLPSIDTKPATQMASDVGTKSVEPPTVKPSPAKTPPQANKKRSRIPVTLLWIVLFALLWAVAVRENPDRLQFLSQLPSQIVEPFAEASSPAVAQDLNVYVEGRVTSVDDNQGIVTVVINGVAFQLMRGMPLHDVVQVGDSVRFEGYYTVIDGFLRFERITRAVHNGTDVTTQ